MVRQTNRAFGLMFAGVFTAITAVGWLVFDARLLWCLGVAAAFAALALSAPQLLLPLNRLWMHFAARLGHVNNRVLLGLFFYVLVTPMGMAMRAFGNDPMTRARNSGTASYFTPVGRQADTETYRDLF